MLSWLKSSSSAPPPAAEAEAVSGAPVVALPPPPQAPTPASAPSPPPPPPARPRARKDVNPNAPYIILACAGTCVGVGVFIGLRQVRQLKNKTLELSAAAAAAEAAQAEAASGSLTSAAAASTAATAASSSAKPAAIGSKPGRTSSILTKGSLAGVQTTPSRTPASKSPFDFLKGPESALSANPAPQQPISASTAALLRKPAPQAAAHGQAAPARQPLFPPSSTRPVAPSSAEIKAVNPSAPLAAASRKPTIRDLIREGRKKEADEHEDLPPMTAGVALRAAGAFGFATGIAVLLVGGPFAAACWWLGVEEPADFTPMFRRKIAALFPSLEEGLLREEAEAAAASAASATPAGASSSDSSSQISFADYLPAFARRSSAAVPSDDDNVDAPSAFLPSILQQGAASEGDDEQGVYAWFESVKQDFERDRLDEMRRRREDDAFYKAWEERVRREEGR